MTNKRTKAARTKARKKRIIQDRLALRQKLKRETKRKRFEQQAQQSAPTPNAKLINDLMVEKRVEGDFKDYVIISGSRLIDWKKSFDIKLDGDKSLGIDGVALIHKRRLHNIVGDEEASRFWHPGLGRIMDVPEGTKPSKQISK